MFPYSDDDVRNLRSNLDEAHNNARIPDLEVARELVEKALKIARSVAKAHNDAERPLHEPDFVKSAETLAGVVEHTSPTIQCRGETMMDRLYQEAYYEVRAAKRLLKEEGINVEDQDLEKTARQIRLEEIAEEAYHGIIADTKDTEIQGLVASINDREAIQASVQKAARQLALHQNIYPDFSNPGQTGALIQRKFRALLTGALQKTSTAQIYTET